MNREVEVIYGPNGEAYLALRLQKPEYYPLQPEGDSLDEQSSSGVVIIDMFEKENISYEF